MFRHKRQKNPPRRRLQEQHTAPEPLRPVVFGGLRQAIQSGFLIGNQGHDRAGEYADRNSGISQRFHGAQTEVGPWCAWLQQPCQARVQRSDGHIHRNRIALRDLFQQGDIAGHQIRFRGYGNLQTAVRGENLQRGAGSPIPSFRRLIRISGGADGDAAARKPPQFAPQIRSNFGLRVDLVFEILALPQFHELMRVARVAVAASKFTTAVGIQAPRKRHARFTPVEQAAGRKFKVLDGPFGLQDFAPRPQRRYSGQVRLGRDCKEHFRYVRLFFACCQVIYRHCQLRDILRFL